MLTHCLRQAVLGGALALDLANCLAYAKQNSWRAWTERFVSLLEPVSEDQWG